MQPGSTINDFDVGPNEGEVHLCTSVSSKTYVVFWLNSTWQISGEVAISNALVVRKIAFIFPHGFVLTKETVWTKTNQFTKLNYGNIDKMLFKSNDWNNMAFTPDYTLCFIWDSKTSIDVINMTTWLKIQSISLPNPLTSSDSTQMITFS